MTGLPAGGWLARQLVERLYDAKTCEEAILCKDALMSIVEADIERGAPAEDVEKSTSKRRQKGQSSTWPNNSQARRLRTRAEKRASAQAAKDSAAEAEARDEQEAAAAGGRRR